MSKPTLNASTEKAKTRSSEVYDTPNEPEVKNGNQSQEITRIGIAEQFPEEIEKNRQTLYPELKKAKAQGHRVRMGSHFGITF